MDFEQAFSRLAEGVCVDLDKYREAQCRKYFAEKNAEHCGDYVKLERYKNRVRIVDTILPHMERFLHDLGVIDVTPERLAKDRPVID